MLLKSPKRSPLGTIVAVVVAAIALYLIFRLFIFVFKLLWVVAPLLIVVAFFIDRRPIIKYVQWMKRLYTRNWVNGLVATILSVALLPFLSLYFIGTAFLSKKVKQKMTQLDEQRNGKWTDYEDVTPEPESMDITYEELPPAPEPEPRQRRRDDNQYDELFK